MSSRTLEKRRNAVSELSADGLTNIARKRWLCCRRRLAGFCYMPDKE
ncbi:hypothetical protein PCH70_08650 [Pseudomonas cichorii JBC1]|nr:hypothetical protein PCH70_08650 [Pseudomonas cichorii JBC1]